MFMKMQCPKCGSIFEGPTEKCPHCGVRFAEPTVNKKEVISERLHASLGMPIFWMLLTLVLGILFIILCAQNKDDEFALFFLLPAAILCIAFFFVYIGELVRRAKNNKEASPVIEFDSQNQRLVVHNAGKPEVKINIKDVIRIKPAPKCSIYYNYGGKVKRQLACYIVNKELVTNEIMKRK